MGNLELITYLSLYEKYKYMNDTIHVKTKNFFPVLNDSNQYIGLY